MNPIFLFRHFKVLFTAYSREKYFFYTTGKWPYNIENIPYEDFEIMIYGHIHQGFIEKKGEFIFANPGSISLPKGGTEHSYIILENNEIILKNVEGKILDIYKY